MTLIYLWSILRIKHVNWKVPAFVDSQNFFIWYRLPATINAPHVDLEQKLSQPWIYVQPFVSAKNLSLNKLYLENAKMLNLGVFLISLA